MGGPQAQSAAESPSRLGRWAAPLFVVVTLAIYSPSLGGEFLWDDQDNVTDNSTLRDMAGLVRMWTDLAANQQYYPLVHTSFWIEYQLFGETPLPFRVTNCLLHGLSAFVLYRVLALLAVPGALLAAALFVVHPVHVESVAWITERKNLLSGLFYLAAAWQFLRFAIGREQGHEGRRAYLLSLLLFVAALLSKTVVLSLPAALLVVLWFRHGRISGEHVKWVLPMFLIAPLFGLITLVLERSHVGAEGAAWDMSLGQHAVVAGRALWFYLQKLLAPWPLMFVYPRWVIAAGPAWQLIFPAAALALPLVLYGLRGRLGRGPVAAVLLFGGTLVPALGFFNVYFMRYSFVQDHFQYLASLGPLSLVGFGLHRLGRRLAAGRLAVAVQVAVVVGLAGLTAQRSAVFRSNEALWQDSISKSSAPALAHVGLAEAYMQAGRYDEAVRQCELAIAANGSLSESHTTLGSAQAALGNFPAAEQAYRRALPLAPGLAVNHINLANVLAAQGKMEAAEAAYRRALELGPDGALAHNNLANILAATGRLKEAAGHYDRATQLDPGKGDYWAGLATAAHRLGDVDGALGFYGRAVALGVRSSPLLGNYGAALAERGRFGEARTQLQAAIALDPNNGQAQANLKRLTSMGK